MKCTRRFAAAAFGATLMLTGSALAQNSQGEPFELVRSLQSLQDQIARGNTRAHANQRALLVRIGEQFDAVDSERWKDPKNARAAVLFVLNGGNARALQKVIAIGKIDGLDEKLLKGILAYGEGRRDEAGELLGGLEARSLDVSLAGHVAYVQGELTLKEPDKALAHFDDARLLAPGTIIEEAALRRQVGLFSAAGKIDRYEALATQYLRRFPNSVYAGSFRQQFALAIVANTNGRDANRLARVAVMLDGIGAAERSDVYLTIAKESLSKQKIELTRFAAAKAGQFAAADSAERVRAQLYEGAVLIVTDDFDKGVEMLSAVDRGKLSEAEIVMLEAALSVAGQLRRLPDAPEPDAAPPADADAGGPAVERARKSIAQVDDLLNGPRQ